MMENVAPHTFLSDAANRSGTYQLLARLWLCEVDDDLLKKLHAPPLKDSFRAVGGILPNDHDPQTMEELSIDFCQLFIGPSNHLPPYQSVWQSGQFEDANSGSMKRFIEITGFDDASLPRGTMLDHLGVQLAVMGHVLDSVATREIGMPAIESVSELLTSFFVHHLCWPSELLSAASQRATTDFYRSVADVTRDFLSLERQDAQPEE